jgi:hypothetical protein
VFVLFFRFFGNCLAFTSLGIMVLKKMISEWFAYLWFIGQYICSTRSTRHS